MFVRSSRAKTRNAKKQHVIFKNLPKRPKTGSYLKLAGYMNEVFHYLTPLNRFFSSFGICAIIVCSESYKTALYVSVSQY